MKQSFKIGKIFLLIIVSVCVFFNYNVGFCGHKQASTNRQRKKSGGGKNDPKEGSIRNREGIAPEIPEEQPSNGRRQEVDKGQGDRSTKTSTDQNQYTQQSLKKNDLALSTVVESGRSTNDQRSAEQVQGDDGFGFSVVSSNILDEIEANLKKEREQIIKGLQEARLRENNLQPGSDDRPTIWPEERKSQNNMQTPQLRENNLQPGSGSQSTIYSEEKEPQNNMQTSQLRVNNLQPESDNQPAIWPEEKESSNGDIPSEREVKIQQDVSIVPQLKTAVIKYFPIDISGGIFDSTFVAMKNVDGFNMESEYLNVKVGFNYNIYLKKDEGDDFNKYIILNPKFFGVDNVYFSIFNYHNFLKNKHTNSEDFKKNYYTLYTKSIIDEINSIYFGASVGYIPFKSVIDDSDKNFKKYMLFASLNTDFGVILFNDYVYFSNLLTLDFNLLRSNYLVNSNKSNEYIKIKDAILLNYEINGLTGLFAGIDFGVYTMHKKFRKDIGLNKNTECNLITGIKFEFGSINASLGNRGVGLGLNMSY